MQLSRVRGIRVEPLIPAPHWADILLVGFTIYIALIVVFAAP